MYLVESAVRTLLGEASGVCRQLLARLSCDSLVCRDLDYSRDCRSLSFCSCRQPLWPQSLAAHPCFRLAWLAACSSSSGCSTHYRRGFCKGQRLCDHGVWSRLLGAVGVPQDRALRGVTIQLPMAVRA